MVQHVFYDLKYFLFFFAFFIGTFGIFLSLLLKDISDYEGIGPIGYYV